MYQRLCSKGIFSVVNIKIISTSLMYLVRFQWHTTTHYSTTDFAMNIHCHDHPAIHYHFFLICWIYEQQLARSERKLLLRNICFKVSFWTRTCKPEVYNKDWNACWLTLHQKIQMLYRQACEEYSKGLGHGPLGSAVDVTNQAQYTVMFHHI